MNGTAVKREIQAVTCGCGSTQFMLIGPSEVYCPGCKQMRPLEWRWKPSVIEANDDWKARTRGN